MQNDLIPMILLETLNKVVHLFVEIFRLIEKKSQNFKWLSIMK